MVLGSVGMVSLGKGLSVKVRFQLQDNVASFRIAASPCLRDQLHYTHLSIFGLDTPKLHLHFASFWNEFPAEIFNLQL